MTDDIAMCFGSKCLLRRKCLRYADQFRRRAIRAETGGRAAVLTTNH